MTEKLKKELETTKALAEEYLSGWKRAKADLSNYQKEVEGQKEEWIKFSTSSVVLTILPIYESIEKLIESVEPLGDHKIVQPLGDPRPPSGDTTIQKSPSGNIKKEYLEGFINIKKQFDNLFKDLGVEKIKTIGEKFDPNFHESIELEESEQESGTIVQEVQSGYVMNGKVIRAAKVIVTE